MVQRTRKNKHFIFTIKQVKEDDIDEELKELDRSCVYCICDEAGKLQYVGKSGMDPMGRIRTYIEEGIKGKRPKDDWAVILIYSKLWVYTHEWAEREIIENYNPVLNTQHKPE